MQLWVDRYVGSWICRLLSMFPFLVRRSQPDHKEGNILVILLAEMGCLVLAKPMFEHLKCRYPNAEIHLLVFERSRDIVSVLNIVPQGNLITIRNSSFAVFVKDSLSAIRRIRRAKIRTVVDCELFSRVSSIFSFLSGASIRVGFHSLKQEGLYRGSFINRRVQYSSHLHMTHQYLNLAESIGDSRQPSGRRIIEMELPEITGVGFNDEELREYGKKITDDFPMLAGRKLVLVYPGGGLLPIRAWPIDRFSQVCSALAEQGYATAVVGREVEPCDLKKLISESANCVDMVHYTPTIRDFLKLLHCSSLLLTNDGGPGHFASLTPTPAVVLFGPETPDLYRPLGQHIRALVAPCSCSPCLTAYNQKQSPCDGDNLCLKSITVEQVLHNIITLLQPE